MAFLRWWAELGSCLNGHGGGGGGGLKSAEWSVNDGWEGALCARVAAPNCVCVRARA